MYFLLAADAVATSTEVSIGDALLLAVIAIAVIMVMLSALMCIIYAMPKVLAFVEKMVEKARTAMAESKKGTAEAEVAEAVAPVVAVAPKALANGSCGEICLYNVEPRTAAMIMAIVANEMETPINELRFKSIKAVSEEV